MAFFAAWVAMIFLMVQALAIASAMEGNISWLMAFGPTLSIVGVVLLPWVFILPTRALRWTWRRIGAADYFAGR
jgi:hypothetical protein